MTVEQLEELLKKVVGDQSDAKTVAADMAKNIDFEASMNRSNLYTPEILEAELARAKALGVNEIDFSRKLIPSLPASLGELTSLRRLRLGHNKLSSLPPTFALLSNLRVLDLSSNNFVLFPDALTKLTSLEILLLEHNQLKSLPPQIDALVNLTELNLFANKLTTLPDCTSLKKLKKLDVELNFIKEVGAWVEEVEELRIDLSVKVLENGKKRSLKDKRASSMALAPTGKSMSFLDALEAEIKENEERKNSKRKNPPSSSKEPPTKKRPTEKKK